ncbi:hypothetical protein GV791_18105 [Nocardia cyriacigeorgica]|uniref:Uncharacterized protein n=1 Tax=Nocardia cyriacigeorgica TaxID=135487 RepID=A0A6P1CWD6_9NOCA|nr:hypothetical protein [Nocardia cyriacigeorgica]NEW34455.1 hypothetical protein [Nocardia cyriacigeorgica]
MPLSAGDQVDCFGDYPPRSVGLECADVGDHHRVGDVVERVLHGDERRKHGSCIGIYRVDDPQPVPLDECIKDSWVVSAVQKRDRACSFVGPCRSTRWSLNQHFLADRVPVDRLIIVRPR